MARMPGATWKGASPSNYTPGQIVRPLRGVILHVIVGSLEAANTVFHDPGRQASAHFGVGKDGRIWQFVDTNDKAFAQGTGNRYWISIETEGQPSEALTEKQLDATARVYRWLHDTEGVDYKVTDSTGGFGFGTHVMGGGAWGGHTCPGPGPRAGQRQEILRRAQGAPTTGGFLMALSDAEQYEVRDRLRNIQPKTDKVDALELRLIALKQELDLIKAKVGA